MTRFVSKVSRVPGDVQRFIEAFQGQGNLRIVEGDVFFEYEAADLWDSREVVENVLGELEGYYYKSDFTFEKPKEVGE